ncbi:MAG: toxin-antitoxin system YwqK family antitoxin [Gracilimonas sp.]|uniref:toxin-antitoxin system YwqK family antitoxin n=1 Tax=Gracilimonas sp. TaxID=1974203 RepID=UPI003752F3C4|nr:toxin-antitoxin system YwqK family antitoxin [Gracilimonas sp.]
MIQVLKFLLLPLFIITLISCNTDKKEQEPADYAFFPELTLKDGAYYKNGEDVPFTGTSGSTYSTGDPYVHADFEEGKMDGKYSAYYSNGTKMGESTYSKGELDGLSESWHDNGNKASEIHFEEGLRQGKLTTYYPSGLIYTEGYFVDGNLDSTYTRWNRDGEIEFASTYDNGELIESNPADSL